MRGRAGAPAPDWGPAAFAAQTRPPVGASNSGPRRAAREQAAVTPSGPAGPPKGPAPPSARTPRTFVGERQRDRRKHQTETLVRFQRLKAVHAVAPGQAQEHQRRQNLGARPFLGASPRLHVSPEGPP